MSSEGDVLQNVVKIALSDEEEGDLQILLSSNLLTILVLVFVPYYLRSTTRSR